MQNGIIPDIGIASQVFTIVWALAVTLPYTSYVLTIRYTKHPCIYDSLFSSDLRCFGTCLALGGIGTSLSILLDISSAQMFIILAFVICILLAGLVRMSRSLRE
jgi:hypothetical protein